MNPTHESHGIHTLLSRQVTKAMLLSYIHGWQHEFPAWKWRYGQDELQPGDWVLDLISPQGGAYSFFLHPVGDVLHLMSPIPLPAEAAAARG